MCGWSRHTRRSFIPFRTPSSSFTQPPQRSIHIDSSTFPVVTQTHEAAADGDKNMFDFPLETLFQLKGRIKGNGKGQIELHRGHCLPADARFEEEATKANRCQWSLELLFVPVHCFQSCCSLGFAGSQRWHGLVIKYGSSSMVYNPNIHI